MLSTEGEGLEGWGGVGRGGTAWEGRKGTDCLVGVGGPMGGGDLRFLAVAP